MLVERLKEYGKATVYFRRAIELDPNDAMAHSNLGAALLRQEKLDEAVAAFRRAIELDPNDSAAHTNLGAALHEQRRPGEAIAAFRKAVELDPKNSTAHMNLGNALSDQGKPDEAIAAYRRAIELDPNYADAHYNLGTDLIAQKKLDEAIAHLRKAIKLDDKHASAYGALGTALGKQGKLDEAVAALKRAIELQPKDHRQHANLGVTLYAQKNLDEAITALRKAVELNPNLADTGKSRVDSWLARCLNERAWALATDPDPDRRDPGRAGQLAKEAVELAQNDPNYWNTLGAAEYRAGHWREAIAALQKYRELRKDDAEETNPFLLAMAHWQLGDREEARRWFDKGAEWMERKNVRTGVTPRLRAEAAELLGIDDKKGSGVGGQGSEKKSN